MKSFYERLNNYEKEKRIINEHEFLFVTEQTRKNSEHACTVDDIEKIIRSIPSNDYGELKLVILRQPKGKKKLYHQFGDDLSTPMNLKEIMCQQ